MKQLWWFLAFVIAGCAAQLNPSGIAPLEDPILNAVLDALPLDTLKSRNHQSDGAGRGHQ